MSADDPISYRAVTKGTPVFGASGTAIGSVEHVLQDSSLDLFDGIAIKTHEGLRFVDANQVGTLTESAVHTTISDADIPNLPKPDGEPVLRADPDQFQEHNLSDWFGRMFLREHWTRDRHEE